MAIHNFVCDSCGNMIQDTNTKGVHVCFCGADMRWDLHNIGIADGDYCHVSDSLAIHPDLIPEHRKLFPNIEVKPDGRPAFTSVRQQEKYANRCGFTKKEQRNRKRGVRIA
jgi:hypothetical protein